MNRYNLMAYIISCQIDKYMLTLRKLKIETTYYPQDINIAYILKSKSISTYFGYSHEKK